MQTAKMPKSGDLLSGRHVLKRKQRVALDSLLLVVQSVKRWQYSVIQCMRHAKLLQSCPTLCSPMDHSPPGPYLHGILHARILEWVAVPSSRGSRGLFKEMRYVTVNWCLPRAFTICLWEDWILCCWSCSPSTHPEGSSGWITRMGTLCSRKTGRTGL